MNQWQPGQSDAMFSQPASSHLNPSALYNPNNTSANPSHFDLSAASSPFQPGLQNGGLNPQTPSAAFNNQTFQPGSVVPQKRPHDGTAGSPPPTSQVSRSQTPAYGAYPGQQPGQQFSQQQQPTPYAHLQQPGSAQATPSPTMQNQHFRQPSQPSRMQNASPSPFPSQQQQQPPGNFSSQMSPTQGQHQSQPMAPQNQMGGYNSQYGAGQGMQQMQGMQNQMGGQGNNMASMTQSQIAQRQYQMRLMQQQQQMRANGGSVPQRPMGGPPGQPNSMYNSAGVQQQPQQQQGGQMPNGAGVQAPNAMMQQQQQQQQAQQQQQQAQQQAQQIKRKAFLSQCNQYHMSSGQSYKFNPAPVIGHKALDLYALWQIVISANGSQAIEANNQWPAVANRLGLVGPGYESAPEQLKNVYYSFIMAYERAWMQARASQKQEQARQQAHQMAGFGPPPQASPTKPMQPPGQQQNQFGRFPQPQQTQPPPQSTPVQANTPVPQQNGVSTPQQMGGIGTIAHRRNSSMQVKRPDAMTPQSAVQGMAAPSPAQKVSRSPSVKHELGGPVMKSEEPQSTNYNPQVHPIEWDGGYDIPVLAELGGNIQRYMPQMPTVDEMGTIDTQAITLSLASGLHGEVRYALDALAIISMDQRVAFELEKCNDLIDVLIDCAEEQLDLLSDEAAEVSDALDLPSYEDIMRGSRTEAEALQDVPAFGTQEYELDRAADKLLAITVILRNFSFYEHNHRLLTTSTLMKWLSNTIRLLGTRNMLLRTYYNTQDFYKDMIIFLSNITQSLELATRDDALHVLHFLLAFAPQPTPSYTESTHKLVFSSFVPSVHRYLPPAVDCLAKLLARQDPNRVLYKSIFTAPASSLASSESPLDLLTRAFALSISVLPDRSKGSTTNTTQLRIVEARKAYLTQGMLAADILTGLAPSNASDLARAWLDSDDGWASSLLSLASLLSVEQPPRPVSAAAKGPPPMGWDVESFRLISYRALMMMKRLAEKAGTSRALIRGFTNGAAVLDKAISENGGEEIAPAVVSDKWDGAPFGHAVIGALMLPNCDKTSLGLLCGLHAMAMRES
jgi:SWI/SNF chromatin-remodeling complex subunit SWI1